MWSTTIVHTLSIDVHFCIPTAKATSSPHTLQMATVDLLLASSAVANLSHVSCRTHQYWTCSHIEWTESTTTKVEWQKENKVGRRNRWGQTNASIPRPRRCVILWRALALVDRPHPQIPKTKSDSSVSYRRIIGHKDESTRTLRSTQTQTR